jgi:hypothetical protein
MNKKTSTIITVSALALALGACEPMAGHKPPHPHMAPGSYTSTETSTDSNGTTTVKESTTDVTVDADGNRNETITSKTSRDPEGLMNKTSTKTKRTTKHKN